MSEFMPQSNPETERQENLMQLIDRYLPDDKEFVADMDFQDALGFVYGQLLEQGEDPEAILGEFGVIERGEDDEV